MWRQRASRQRPPSPASEPGNAMSFNQNSSKGDGLEIISFHLGDQVFSVNIMSVREIRGWAPVTPLAHSPAHVLGVINLRGSVIPVIDMAVRLGLEPIERVVLGRDVGLSRVVGLAARGPVGVLGKCRRREQHRRGEHRAE